MKANDNYYINPSFWPLYTNKQRFKVLVGGSGSSKSYSGSQYALSRFLTEKGCNVLVIRKVGNTIKKSIFALMVQLLNKLGNHGCKINKSDYVITAPNDNQMYFSGIDDPEKIKSVTCINGIIEMVVIEEASELNREDFLQLNLRVRGNTGIRKELLLFLNPINKTHWIKIDFFDKKLYDAFLHRSTYKDNLFIDKDYVEELKRMKEIDYYHYMVYALGEWGSLDDSNIIISPRLMIEAAEQKINMPPGGLTIGIDVARFGDDKAVIYHRKGSKFYEPISYDRSRTTTLSKKAIEILTTFRAKYGQKLFVIINVDVTGIGSGVVDELEEWRVENKIFNVKVNEINFGGEAKEKDVYADTVTEMYFEFKNMLENEYIDLPMHSVTINEASTRCYTVDKKSRLKIEPKDIFKKRIGKSPDFADALMLAAYNPKMELTWSDVL